MDPDLQRELRFAYPHVFAECEFNVGDGWHRLLCIVGQNLTELKAGQVTLAYVKFGELRLNNSLHAVSKKISSFIEDCRWESRKICEDCGYPGQGNDHYGYYKTTCPSCMLVTKRKQNPTQFAKDYPEVLAAEKRRKRLVGFSVIYQGQTVYVDLNKESFEQHRDALGDLIAKLKEHGLRLED